MARRAVHLAHVLLDLLAGPVRLGLAVAALQPGDDAFEYRLVGPLAPEPVLVGDPDRLGGRAVEDELLVLGLERLPRRVEVEATELGHAGLEPGEVLAARPGPGGQRPFGQREAVVRHDQLGVHLELGPQAHADRTGTVGRVEGEAARLGLVEADAAVGAGQVLGERDGFVGRGVARPVHDQDLGGAPGQLERRLDRLGQALADPVAAHQAVDHDLDGVDLVTGQGDLGALGQLDGDAVDPDPGEALLGQVVEQGAVLPLAAPHDRGENLELRALGELEHPVDDLLRRLARHGPAAGRAVRVADAGIQKAQVVVDLGDGTDGRTRVAGGRFLVDGDGGREALDEIDVGLVHLAQELAGVGGEGLDVAALALGVDRVEGQGGLPRARETGEDDQLVPGQVEGYIAEVVLARTANDETIGH